MLVLPNIEMNPPQVYVCSPSWTHLPPPSPYHPSGSSQCTRPKHPVYRTWTGNSFHTWYYTCFNAILPNLPTLSLSHRVHKTVLYIRNKTRVPTFTITVQHSFGSFGHSNQSRKRNKRNPNWERRSKTLTKS